MSLSPAGPSVLGPWSLHHSQGPGPGRWGGGVQAPSVLEARGPAGRAWGAVTHSRCARVSGGYSPACTVLRDSRCEWVDAPGWCLPSGSSRQGGSPASLGFWPQNWVPRMCALRGGIPPALGRLGSTSISGVLAWPPCGSAPLQAMILMNVPGDVSALFVFI